MVQRRKIGGVYIEIEGDNRDYKRKVRDSIRESDRAADKMQGDFRRTQASARALNQEVNRTSKAMAGLGAAVIAFAGASSIRTIANFEQAMSTVAAVTQATEGQMRALEAQAKLLGSTTRFSASQAAEGMIFLARAGFSVEDVLGSINSALNLAQAGELDLARAADIASNVMSGFALDTSQAARVMDVLAAAANNSNTDIRQLGEALKFAAPTAVALGLDLEETVALIGKLSDAGIQAGLAGRGFQSLTTQFVNQQEKIEELIGAYDIAEEGVDNVVRRLVQAGITTAEISEIFRAENLDVFTIIANSAGEGERSISALEQTLRDAEGTVVRVARTMDDNLNGAILAAQSALEALVLALGEIGSSDAVRAALGAIADLLRLAADNADVLAVAFIALTARAIIPLVGAMGTSLVGAVTRANAQIAALEAISGRAIGGLGRLRIALAAFGGPVTLALTAAAAAFATMALNSKDAGDRIGAATENLRNLQTVQESIRSDTEKLATLQNNLAEAIESQGDAAVNTARLEIEAVRERIRENENLARTYESIARAQLAQAQAELRNDTRGALRQGTRVLGNDRALEVAAAANGTGQQFYEAVIEAARQDIFARQDANETLSGRDLQFLETIAEIDRLTAQADAAREALNKLTAGPESPAADGGGDDLRDLLGVPTPSEIRRAEREAEAAQERLNRKKIEAAEKAARERAEAEEKAAREASLRGTLEDDFELEQRRLDLSIAQAQEDEKAIAAAQAALDAVEDRLLLEELIAQYTEANVTNAQDRAEAEVETLRALRDQLRTEEAAQAERRRKANEQKEDELFDEADLRDRTKRAVVDAVADGDFGDALKTAVGSAFTAGMEKALNDIVDELFDVFKNIFSSSGGIGGGGFGGAIGSFFGNIFGGFASGGSVLGGRAIIVGERGPELFVPGADGLIIPNKLPAPANGATTAGGGGITVVTNLNVEGNLVRDTVEVIDERLAAYSKSLPRMVQTEVSRGQRRGRF